MKLVGALSTAVLTLSLGIGIPAYAQQEQHDQQEENKDKPAQEREKKAQPEQSAKPDEKNARQEEKSAKPEERKAQEEKNNNNNKEERNAQQQREQNVESGNQEERAPGNSARRIPEDRYKANFGREHSFRVSESDYRNHRFQYGGYWFGFQSAWPSNWLYTQDVYVVEINGVYYLCNASYPGVNLMLSVTL